MSSSDVGFQAALEEAKKGASEGGVPIGACLVSADGKILGRGHNMRMQKDSPTIHVSQAHYSHYISLYTSTLCTDLISITCTSIFSIQKCTTTSKPNNRQAEISALENAGRLPASAYKGATMYTTLSPCDMCTGACILYKIPRVVLGENNTFLGGEAYLQSRGVEVVNVESKECEELMSEFIRKQPEDW